MISAAIAAVPSMVDEATQIPEWVHAYSVGRLASALHLAKGLEPALGKQLLELAYEIEEERVESMADLAWGDTRSGDVRGLLEALGSTYSWMQSALPNGGEQTAAECEERPIRTTDGPLPYAVTDAFDSEETEDFNRILGLHHRGVANSLFGLCDGSRSVEQIALQLMLDYDRPVAVNDIRRGVELLAKAGVIEF